MIRLLPAEALEILAAAGQELPNTWIGLLGLIIFTVPSGIGAAAGLGAVFVSWRTRKKVGDVQTTVNATSGNVNQIQTQVTNGGSNLAATVGDLRSTLARIESRQQDIYTNHLGPMSRNIATLHEGVQAVREDVALLERKVEERTR